MKTLSLFRWKVYKNLGLRLPFVLVWIDLYTHPNTVAQFVYIKTWVVAIFLPLELDILMKSEVTVDLDEDFIISDQWLEDAYSPKMRPCVFAMATVQPIHWEGASMHVSPHLSFLTRSSFPIIKTC